MQEGMIDNAQTLGSVCVITLSERDQSIFHLDGDILGDRYEFHLGFLMIVANVACGCAVEFCLMRALVDIAVYRCANC